MAKKIVAAIWAWGLLCVISPGLPLAVIGVTAVKAMAVVHAIECAFFYKTLRETGESLPGHLLQTFFFGIIHYQTVKAELAARQEA